MTPIRSTTRQRPALKTARAAGVTERACRREETADKRGHVAPAGGKQGGVASRPTVQVPQPTLTERQPHDTRRALHTAAQTTSRPHCHEKRPRRPHHVPAPRFAGRVAVSSSSSYGQSPQKSQSAPGANPPGPAGRCASTGATVGSAGASSHAIARRRVIRSSIRAPLNRYGFSSRGRPGGAGNWLFFFKNIGPDCLQVHPARVRYSGLSPLTDRWHPHPAQACDLGGSTQRIDDF